MFAAPAPVIVISAVVLALITAAFENGGTLPLADVDGATLAAAQDAGLVWVDAATLDLKARAVWAVQKSEAPDYVGQILVTD